MVLARSRIARMIAQVLPTPALISHGTTVCPRCHHRVQASPCPHCGAEFVAGVCSTPGEQQSGVSSGAYRVEGIIASGGMGVVMRGRRIRDGHPVALKAPRSNHSLARERFTREARALATVHHPNVVRLIDIDATRGGTPLLITEFIEGLTLHQRLQHASSMAYDEFEHIARQTMRAVAHCHRRGIIHRDIKPDNIILRSDGSGISLVDFGLALLTRDLQQHLRLTPEGLALGTPPFAAPEQLHNPLSASLACDAYSIGKVLELCWHKVDWQEHKSLADEWQQHIRHLTAQIPSSRPPVDHILHHWPTGRWQKQQPRPWQRSWYRGWRQGIIVALLCAIAALVAIGPIATPAHEHLLSGWLDEDGRGSVAISVDAQSTVELIPSGDTRIRLLGHGPWSDQPIRLRGNASGIIRVRVAADDGQWELRVRR